MPRRNVLPRLRLAALFAVLSVALTNAPLAAPTTVDLASEASRSAVNDLFRSTVAAEASGATPGAPADEVNRLIAAALKTTQGYPAVKAKTNGVSSYPVYAANSARIEGWRVRAEIVLETADSAALSELLGKLQARLTVASLVTLPSPATRKKAEDEAIVEGIAAFKARARLIADTLGGPFAIKHLGVASEGRMPPPVMLRSKGVMAADASTPIEAGSSQVSVSVSGQIVVGE